MAQGVLQLTGFSQAWLRRRLGVSPEQSCIGAMGPAGGAKGIGDSKQKRLLQLTRGAKMFIHLSSSESEHHIGKREKEEEN